MDTTHSADSDSVEPHGSVFLGDRVVTSFPRHEVVKLDEGSFVQWQQQVRLILRGYGLFGLLDGSLTAPARFVQSSSGDLVVNPAVSIFDQQDSLLTSWLVSTTGSSFLSSFTDVRTARDVWTVATNLFAADSTSGSQISEDERTAVLLAGLSSEFDAIVSSVSLSTSVLPFQRVVDALLECEARQVRSAQEVLVAANTVEGPPLPPTDGSFRGGGRSSVRGRGRSFRPRVQCQICSRYGHIAQRCYYRYDRDAQSLIDAPLGRRGGFVSGMVGRSDDRNDGQFGVNYFSQNWSPYGQNWRPSIWPNSGFDGGVPRGPHAGNPFVSHGSRQYDNVGPNSFGNGRDFVSGQSTMGFQFNNEVLGSRPRGTSGSVRSRPTDGQFMPEPSANCVDVDRSWQTVREAPWRTKPRARVFSVASSPYDSSQFVGLPPRLPELHASDYSGATEYDSNFNSTDSYVPVGGTSWCPDSGATHHVCRNASDLHDTTPYTGNSSLLMGNGVSTSISSVGSTTIPTTQKLLHLSNVLCVPSIRKNLLSVSKFATDNNVFFEFHPSYCVIKDIQTQEILIRGQVRDGLYQFSARSSGLSPSAHSAVVQYSSPADDVFSLWHKRLGHPAPNIVKAILDKCHITVNKNQLDNVCVTCQKGKSHKLPFPRSSTEYGDLFELVVSDVWGPAVVPYEGNLYYVSFVDMTSRFTWVYLINRKSQVVDCFGQFQKMVQTQFGKCIKKFQSDWGGEFRVFSSMLARQGILHRVSCPYTSEQNGVAERKHRHIVETGLALLAQANLPMQYWGYAFCSAVHLINRLPTPVLSGQSPYQRLFGHEPTYGHLRVFGCCCFPHLRPFVKHKLEFQSQPSTFLGYSAHHKGYFCLTPDDKVIVSRHVVFDETRFLFPLLSSTGTQPSSGNPTYVPVVRSFTTTDTCSPSASPPAGTGTVQEVVTSGTGVRDEATATSIAPAE
ncbi:hypothetical protein CXB51_017047 [Gossypium anomalum]|uniref:Integrase catalytic domain-containing protein n=1 Tax=Gossypium anomalum TaxID=47600 RepID=A0A8J5YUD9_9ROSI|nr:hypothetical protein CXB51_017047 [Gossypium anomalum]